MDGLLFVTAELSNMAVSEAVKRQNMLIQSAKDYYSQKYIYYHAKYMALSLCQAIVIKERSRRVDLLFARLSYTYRYETICTPNKSLLTLLFSCSRIKFVFTVYVESSFFNDDGGEKGNTQIVKLA